jgi:DNA repair protein RecO (recombination protein O)
MSQQRSYSTEATVLKYSDLGEADRILTLFTPYKGKIRVIAKGIRRTISKKAGHLDLLSRSQLHIAQGRNLDIVTQAQTIDSFLNLRADLWHIACALYLAEIVDRFLEDDNRQTEVYNLLLETLHALDADALAQQPAPAQTQEANAINKVPTEPATTTAPTPDPTHNRSLLLLRYFEIHLLSYVGYEPVFRSCAHCHNELQPQENGFTASMGGALCPDCSNLWGQPLSMHALKVLRILQRSEWSQVPAFRLDARLHAEVKSVMYGLIRYHLERNPQSWIDLDRLSLH